MLVLCGLRRGLLLPLLSDISPPSLLQTLVLVEGRSCVCSHCWLHCKILVAVSKAGKC